MERYHKKIYFPTSNIKKLIDFTDYINCKDFIFSIHCLDRIKESLSLGDISNVLEHIKELQYKFSYDDIFEFYSDNGDIIKVCYRLKYSDIYDIILVIGQGKKLITIYLNEINDNHITLKSELYNTE